MTRDRQAGHEQRRPERVAVGLKPSATGSEGRLRGLDAAAQASLARASQAVYGDGDPGALTVHMPQINK